MCASCLGSLQPHKPSEFWPSLLAKELDETHEDRSPLSIIDTTNKTCSSEADMALQAAKRLQAVMEPNDKKARPSCRKTKSPEASAGEDAGPENIPADPPQAESAEDDDEDDVVIILEAPSDKLLWDAAEEYDASASCSLLAMQCVWVLRMLCAVDFKISE